MQRKHIAFTIDGAAHVAVRRVHVDHELAFADPAHVVGAHIVRTEAAARGGLLHARVLRAMAVVFFHRHAAVVAVAAIAVVIGGAVVVDVEHRAATLRHPDAALIGAPGLTFDARAIADLLHHAHAAAGLQGGAGLGAFVARFTRDLLGENRRGDAGQH